MRAPAKRRSVQRAALPPPAAEEGTNPSAADAVETGIAPEWRDVRSDPPFDLETEGKQAHGPFEIQLRSGEIVMIPWAHGSTASGGSAWGWKAPDGRLLAFGAVERWRDVGG